MTGVPGSIVISLGARHLIEGVVITNEEVTGWSNDRLPLAIVLALVATLISGVGGLATAWVMLRTVDETPDLDRTERLPWREDATLAGRSLAAALPMLPRAIGWYLLLLLAVSVVAGSIVAALIVATPFGVLLIVAAIPLGAWIMLKLAFVLQAIVDRPGNPIRRSAEVSRRRWWAVCGRLLLVGVIAWAISMAINITSSIVRAIGGDNSFGTTTFEFDENGPVDPIVLADVLPLSTTAIVVGVVAGALLSVCVGGLTNAAFAELYRTRNAAE